MHITNLHATAGSPSSQPQENAMRQALAVIQSEHQSLRVVLDRMQQVVLDMRAGQMPCDCVPLKLMLQYIRTFPDALHHPKEDHYLFAKLRERTGEFDPVIQELSGQHASAADWLNRLELALMRFEGGFPPAFETFKTALDEYCELQRRHMQIEESVIIPAAAEYLTMQDWEEIAEAFSANGDPRFSALPEKACRNLYTKIVHTDSPLQAVSA